MFTFKKIHISVMCINKYDICEAKNHGFSITVYFIQTDKALIGAIHWPLRGLKCATD